MGNRQSSTDEKEADIKKSLETCKEEINEDEDEDDSYDVREYKRETVKNDTRKEFSLLDNTDESNNTQSESTTSNQSFGSCTTPTKYGETNSVVTSDYDSEGSWSDTGDTSKSNTVSKDSTLCDTDDITALTDLAHFGDDEGNEGTKNARDQAKKKRRSKWLKMIYAQQKVKVFDNDDENEVEAILENEDDHSLQSMLMNLKSLQKTDGDEDTTIHIIDAEEEYSRCSSYNGKEQYDDTQVVSANDYLVLLNDSSRRSNPDTRKESELLRSVLKSDVFAVNGDGVTPGHPPDLPFVASNNTDTIADAISDRRLIPNAPQSLSNVDGHDGVIENDQAGRENANLEKEFNLKDENQNPILFIDGLVGDPVEANVKRLILPTLLQHEDSERDGIVLKTNSSLNHIALSVESESSSTNSKFRSSKRTDPVGTLVRGSDIPERNKPKISRKLLDDVELNPRRVEALRQALLESNTTTNVATKVEGTSLPVIATTDKTKQTPVDLEKKAKSQLPVRSVASVKTDHMVTKQSENRSGNDSKDDILVDKKTHEIVPLKETTIPECTMENVIDNFEIKPAKERKPIHDTVQHINSVPENTLRSSSEQSQLIIVQAQDVHIPILFARRMDQEVIVGTQFEVNKIQMRHDNVTETTLAVSMDKNASRYSKNAAKPVPESSLQRSKSPTDSNRARNGVIVADERHTIFNIQRENKNDDNCEKRSNSTSNVPSNKGLQVTGEGKRNQCDRKEPSSANIDYNGNREIIDAIGSGSDCMNKNPIVQKSNVNVTSVEMQEMERSPFDEDDGKSKTHQLPTYTEEPTHAKFVHESTTLSKRIERNVENILGVPTDKLHNRPSTQKIIIRPESLYIETPTINDDTVTKDAYEPKKKMKSLSPKPEHDDHRVRRCQSRPSKDASSVVDIVEDEDDIDFRVVKQYDETFNELLRQYPQFMLQNPNLVETIRVAKLQKILSATLEMKRELEEYVNSLISQKKEVSSHYHKKLLEASQKKAAREVQAQKELETMKAAVKMQARNDQWDFLRTYKDYCTQHRNIQEEHLIFQEANTDDPLSMLPKNLLDEKKCILDALMSPYDADHFDDATMRIIRMENLALSQEVKELEQELLLLHQSSVANDQEDFSWVE